MLRGERFNKADRVIRVGFWINAVLMVLKLAAGHFGHSEAVHIETRDKITAAQARALLEKAPGVKVIDDHKPGGYPTAVTEAANHDTVYVGRIREDMSHDRGLDLWVVADNIRKGAASNAVQIAEILARDYL